MYVRIKVANQQDACMLADILRFWENEVGYAIVEQGILDLIGWWFVRSHCSEEAIEIALSWAAENKVKIFSIETGRGNIYYEAES